MDFCPGTKKGIYFRYFIYLSILFKVPLMYPNDTIFIYLISKIL